MERFVSASAFVRGECVGPCCRTLSETLAGTIWVHAGGFDWARGSRKGNCRACSGGGESGVEAPDFWFCDMFGKGARVREGQRIQRLGQSACRESGECRLTHMS